MSDITTLLDSAETLWTGIAALGVLVLGFMLGRKLIRKAG